MGCFGGETLSSRRGGAGGGDLMWPRERDEVKLRRAEGGEMVAVKSKDAESGDSEGGIGSEGGLGGEECLASITGSFSSTGSSFS